MAPFRTTLLLLLASLPASALSAEGLATLKGLVKDETGLVLPGVTIEARAAAHDPQFRRTSTDERGAYEFVDLPPGRYLLAFRRPSFATTVKLATVEADQAASVDATLVVRLSADVLVTGRRTLRNLADLDEPTGGLLGLANAGSEGVVSAALIEQRPAYRVAEVYETVPGVVVSQHSGEGKASQYYVRGFNIDHGTDLATSVAGVLVNMPTHAHGQGYADNSFMIPELVSGVQYQKGTYSAENGDFSAAGSINVNYLNVLDRPLFKLEGGANRLGRVLAMGSTRIGESHVLFAGEAHHSDGPWINPDDYRKLNAVVRYSRGNQQSGLSLTAMGYWGQWNSTDQVPARAVASGAIGRFAAIDATDGGQSHRLTLSGEWRRSGSHGLTQVKAYAIDYGLDLFSNFTYALDDPENGDQFEQKDDRTVLGASLSQRFLGRWFGKDTQGAFGLQTRRDSIPTVGLYRTKARRRRETVRQDAVDQSSGAVFFEASIQWSDRVRTVTGVRGDLYRFDVRGDDPANSGFRTASLASPKLSLVLGPWKSTELYANWGVGFHSNDGRGAVQTRDPKTGEAVAPVDPLVRARGVELGLRTLAIRRYHSTLSVFGLDVASELLFVGDAGSTQASRPSRRLGIEWSNVFTPTPWLTLDADLARSRARFRDGDPAGDRVPGAIEGVASAGLTVQGRWAFSGSLRLRYFGPRPLVEDDSVRSTASTTVNARASWRFRPRYSLSLDAFNLTDSKVSDIDYFYVSRLPGELADGRADVHTHPLASRAFRLNFTASF